MNKNNVFNSMVKKELLYKLLVEGELSKLQLAEKFDCSRQAIYLQEKNFKKEGLLHRT